MSQYYFILHKISRISNSIPCFKFLLPFSLMDSSCHNFFLPLGCKSFLRVGYIKPRAASVPLSWRKDVLDICLFRGISRNSVYVPLICIKIGLVFSVVDGHDKTAD